METPCLWRRYPTVEGSAELEAVSCPSSDFCVAVGAYNFHDSILNPATISDALVEFFNGTSWIPVPRTAFRGNLDSVSCVSSTFCMAVGYESFLASDMTMERTARRQSRY